jgi:hypothetical protein
MLVMSVNNRRRRIRQPEQAHAQSISHAIVRGTGYVADEIPMFTYWNHLDKSPTVDLTNLDLTATASGDAPGGQGAAVRAIDGKTAGKWYFEITNGNVSISSGSGVGLVAGGVPINNAFFSTANGIVLLGNGGIFINEVFQFTLGPINEARMGIAYNADLHLVWMRIDNDLWNDDPDADPSTGIGGLDVSEFDQLGLWPACGVSGTGHTFTANFGHLPFVDVKPVGYSGWTTEGS